MAHFGLVITLANRKAKALTLKAFRRTNLKVGCRVVHYFSLLVIYPGGAVTLMTGQVHCQFNPDISPAAEKKAELQNCGIAFAGDCSAVNMTYHGD